MRLFRYKVMLYERRACGVPLYRTKYFLTLRGARRWRDAWRTRGQTYLFWWLGERWGEFS